MGSWDGCGLVVMDRSVRVAQWILFPAGSSRRFRHRDDNQSGGSHRHRAGFFPLSLFPPIISHLLSLPCARYSIDPTNIRQSGISSNATVIAIDAPKQSQKRDHARGILDGVPGFSLGLLKRRRTGAEACAPHAELAAKAARMNPLHQREMDGCRPLSASLDPSSIDPTTLASGSSCVKSCSRRPAS